MATLTETAYYTRKAIRGGILGILLFFFLKIVLDFSLATWRKINPPPPPPPTVAFGKLPALKFPPVTDGASPSASLNYTLETIEGGLPITPPTAAVFFIPKTAANLLSATRAVQFAAQLGFTGEPEKISERLYRWQAPNSPLKKLEIDILTFNFKISYDYASDVGVFAEKNLPTAEEAVREAVSFLERLGLAHPSLINGQSKTSFWQLAGSTLLPTTSLLQADAVRVDFSRENIAERKLLPSHPPEQSVYFIFSGNRNSANRMMEVSYRFWQVEKEQSATYPLKPAASAWEELKAGRGHLARIGKTTPAVVIRTVSLAYFYSEEYQSFLQPIFVFEGDPDFIGYVPAISPDWTE